MKVITNFNNGEMKMFELDTMEEVQEILASLEGISYVTEIIYFNDPQFEQAA